MSEAYEVWSQWQHADELARQQQIMSALEAAEKAGTPHETVILLADECGVGEFYRKHHEPKGN